MQCTLSVGIFVVSRKKDKFCKNQSLQIFFLNSDFLIKVLFKYQFLKKINVLTVTLIDHSGLISDNIFS